MTNDGITKPGELGLGWFWHRSAVRGGTTRWESGVSADFDPWLPSDATRRCYGGGEAVVIAWVVSRAAAVETIKVLRLEPGGGGRQGGAF